MSEHHTASRPASRPPRGQRHSSFCERHAGLISILAMLHLALVALALHGGELCPAPRRPITHVLRVYQQLAGLAPCPGPAETAQGPAK